MGCYLFRMNATGAQTDARRRVWDLIEWDVAFCWFSRRGKSLVVLAVVVDTEVVVRPLEIGLLLRGKVMIRWPVPAWSHSRVFATSEVPLTRNLASRHVMEPVQISNKRRVHRVVDFDATTLSSPAASVPVWHVQSLSLVKIWETVLLIVHVNAERDIINSNSAIPRTDSVSGNDRV